MITCTTAPTVAAMLTMAWARNRYPYRKAAFKIPAFNNVDRSDNYMATINLKTDLPLGKLPLRLFFDAGLIPNEDPDFNHPGNTTILYDGGVEVYIIKDIVSVYVPVIMSSDFQNYLQNTLAAATSFTRSLSFTFDLHNIIWLKAPESGLKLVTN